MRETLNELDGKDAIPYYLSLIGFCVFLIAVLVLGPIAAISGTAQARLLAMWPAWLAAGIGSIALQTLIVVSTSEDTLNTRFAPLAVLFLLDVVAGVSAAALAIAGVLALVL